MPPLPVTQLFPNEREGKGGKWGGGSEERVKVKGEIERGNGGKG
jgi:hypothetical protein